MIRIPTALAISLIPMFSAASEHGESAAQQTDQETAQGRIFDMRQCPLDTITFVDPWAGGDFAVTEVGTNYSYLCRSGWQPHAPAGEECSGPYGELILKGTLRQYAGSESQTAFAVWNVIKGAPCCWWEAFPADAEQSLSSGENFEWLEKGNMPTLGEFGFASIDGDSTSNEAFSSLFGNPMMAMLCELR